MEDLCECGVFLPEIVAVFGTLVFTLASSQTKPPIINQGFIWCVGSSVSTQVKSNRLVVGTGWPEAKEPELWLMIIFLTGAKYRR